MKTLLHELQVSSSINDQVGERLRLTSARLAVVTGATIAATSGLLSLIGGLRAVVVAASVTVTES